MIFTEAQTSAENFGATGCEGIVDGIPTAPPGKLCVYTRSEGLNGFQAPAIEDWNGASNTAEPAGAFLNIESKSPAGSGELEVVGDWAVTAP